MPPRERDIPNLIKIEIVKDQTKNTPPEWSQSAAPHTIAAIQAFIAGAAADGDMTTGITGRGIALHASGGCVDGIQAVIGASCGSDDPGGF